MSTVEKKAELEYDESGYRNDSPYKKHPCKAVSTIIGGFVYMMFPGSVYCTGILSPYIKSYYRLPNSTYVNDLLPACLIMNMLFMAFGSYLVQKNVNPRIMIAIGAAVAFPCFFIGSFMYESFPAFAVFYVIGFSFNQGMAYMVPVHHGWLWWPKNPGLVSGIILGGFGFGGLIFDNLMTAVINPYGDKI